MIDYILKRLFYLVFVMIGVSILTFALSQIIPGDPAELILKEMGMEATREEIEILRDRLGLNDPLIVQYGRWTKNVLKGDLGRSFRTGTAVTEEIITRIPATIELTLGGLIIMIFLALPIGVLSAVFKNRWIDHCSRLFAFFGASIPSFCLGLMLIYFFSVKLSIFPVMGRGTLLHLFLPSFTLGVGMATTYARLIRASMLEILGQDFILAARSRGLKENLVIINNALRNALIPVTTAFGMNFGHLLGGTVIIENIFAWPGVGKFLVESIFNRDYPVIQGYVLWMAMIFVLANLVVDISYRLLDPRISIGGKM
ncbi:gluthatione ABC transport system permease protein GsiC [Clostridium aceticum]|uniref:Nickel import system permease protein NikB n=1 Tax=Clostridium aceticum TaxID=84022 RepID=A0A0D8I918_9CLOT|nr:nickel ABC transporter permease [Clostridium aceticum]AKL95874.1 gluthatione ABC transport system permease protein GsiC [Clostridium aceticum]KJF26539.1 nickel transporter permease NikB [Clostridium aceticum]